MFGRTAVRAARVSSCKTCSEHSVIALDPLKTPALFVTSVVANRISPNERCLSRFVASRPNRLASSPAICRSNARGRTGSALTFGANAATKLLRTAASNVSPRLGVCVREGAANAQRVASRVDARLGVLQPGVSPFEGCLRRCLRQMQRTAEASYFRDRNRLGPIREVGPSVCLGPWAMASVSSRIFELHHPQHPQKMKLRFLQRGQFGNRRSEHDDSKGLVG